jgi:hypothetical protein
MHLLSKGKKVGLQHGDGVFVYLALHHCVAGYHSVLIIVTIYIIFVQIVQESDLLPHLNMRVEKLNKMIILHIFI